MIYIRNVFLKILFTVAFASILCTSTQAAGRLPGDRALEGMTVVHDMSPEIEAVIWGSEGEKRLTAGESVFFESRLYGELLMFLADCSALKEELQVKIVPTSFIIFCGIKRVKLSDVMDGIGSFYIKKNEMGNLKQALLNGDENEVDRIIGIEQPKKRYECNPMMMRKRSLLSQSDRLISIPIIFYVDGGQEADKLKRALVEGDEIEVERIIGPTLRSIESSESLSFSLAKSRRLFPGVDQLIGRSEDHKIPIVFCRDIRIPQSTKEMQNGDKYAAYIS